MAHSELLERRPKKPRASRKRVASKKKAASNVINLRANEATRDLIDRAAAASGQNRTEFMLYSARVHAEHVLLNQVYFQLGDEDWDALNATLAAPPPANATLKKAYRSTPLWERQSQT